MSSLSYVVPIKISAAIMHMSHGRKSLWTAFNSKNITAPSGALNMIGWLEKVSEEILRRAGKHEGKVK